MTSPAPVITSPASSRPPLWHRVLAATVVAYTAFVIVWFLALHLWRDGWWPLILVNFAVVEPILLAPLALLAAMATRQQRLVALALVPPLLYASLFWPYLIPDLDAGPSPDEIPTVRVMTYNILHSNDDLDAIVAIIDRYEPDLVAIQELPERNEGRLRDALTDSHPHSIIGRPARGGTTALFSRTPLTRMTELDFGVGRPAVIATTTIDGHEVVAASAHLLPAFWALSEPRRRQPAALDRYIDDQNSQAEQLIAELRGYPDVVTLFACDCNTREPNETNEILTGYLIDPIRELGFPIRRSSLPGTAHERRIAHIDYVWYREAGGTSVEVDGVYRVEDTGGSDHHPIIADVTLGS